MAALIERFAQELFAAAGIALDGSEDWDIEVREPRFFRRILRGSLGFGESYMDGDWDCRSLDALFRRLMRARLDARPLVQLNRLWLQLRSRLTNLQTRRGSQAIAEAHYDLDHRLYAHFLGPWNQYTCCFFDRAHTLEEAETEKLEMVCNKLGLREGQHVLDIGCGWGGFARYAAGTRGCRVTGVSISGEQVEYARAYTAGLPVEILHCDYRDLSAYFEAGRFDRAVIIGMIEHVGYKNYRQLFGIVHELLADHGLFLLHTIGNSRVTTVVDPWIEKYIFRNSMAPAMAQLAESLEGLFIVQDWENYGHFYPPTLAAWHTNFERNWPAIEAIDTPTRFDQRFRRMFNYYFLSCKAGFETEQILLWHLVMSKEGHGRAVYPRVNLLQ